jgi:hypothetical protein
MISTTVRERTHQEQISIGAIDVNDLNTKAVARGGEK